MLEIFSKKLKPIKMNLVLRILEQFCEILWDTLECPQNGVENLSWQICLPLHALLFPPTEWELMMPLLSPKSLSLYIMRTHAVYKELCFPRMKESYITQIKQFDHDPKIPLW